MRHRIILSIALIAFCTLLWSQHIEDIPGLEQYIEDLIAQDENIDPSLFMQDVDYFLLNPVNLNIATKEELSRLPLLNEFQVQSFLDYRKKVKQLVSIYELQYIPGFNNKLAWILAPLVVLKKEDLPDKMDLKTIPKVVKYNHQSLMVETASVLQDKKGYQPIIDTAGNSLPSNYAGTSQKLKMRYDFNYRNQIMAGVVTEKDPGENYLNGQTNRPDYISAHVMYQGNKYLKNIVVGDYNLEKAQGLLINTGYGKSKSLYFSNLTKSQHRIKRNLSANESGYLRGAATKLGFNSIELIIFTSYKQTDATYTDSTNDYATSLYTTGLHRTETELQKTDNIIQTNLGGSIHLNKNRFGVGLNALQTNFSNNLIIDSSRYDAQDITGNSFTGFSADYKYLSSRLQFYGEAAYSNYHYAVINMLAFNLYQNNQLLLLHRWYDKDYYSPLANGFCEGSGIKNEEGLFIGIDIVPMANWRIIAYYDIFKFPWLRYYVNSPTYGSDGRIKAEYSPSRDFTAYAQYYYQKKEDAELLEAEDIVKSTFYITEQKLRVNVQYKLSENLSMKDRVELSDYKSGNETCEGWLILHDTKWQTPLDGLSADIRFSWFNIADYNARIYAYENSAPYSYSVPAYYGIGRRWYVLIRYNIKTFASVYLKYSQTTYDDLDEIGSGNELIEGNRKSDVSLQVSLKF